MADTLRFISDSILLIKRKLGHFLRTLQIILLPPQLREQQPPPTPDAAPAPRAGFAANNLDRPLLVLGFCFTAVYNPMIQNINYIPIEYYFARLMLILSFSALFLSMYMSWNSESALGRVLQHFGVFLGATAFFLDISLLFPVWVKLVFWSVYALTLLGIYLSYRFN